jgi:hypothetical protein
MTNIGPRLRFERFEWSGKNSHLARCQAARELCTHILGVHGRLPTEPHFLVAHSHGGNIGLYALRSPDVRLLVRGIVTMSTPFIVCRPRDLGSAPLRAMAVLCSLFYILAMCSLLHSEQWGLFALLSVGTPIALVLIVAIIEIILRRCTDGLSLAEAVRALRESFSLAKVSEQELLIVRSAGDEASGVLAIAHLSSWCMAVVSRIVSKLYSVGEWIRGTKARALSRGRGDPGVISLILGIVIIGYAFVAHNLSFPLQAIIFSTGIVLTSIGLSFSLDVDGNDPFQVVGGIFQAIGGALLIPIVLLLSVFSAPFGLDTMLSATLFEFSAESSPPGTYKVTQTDAKAIGLSHSSPYSNVELLKKLADFVISRDG